MWQPVVAVSIFSDCVYFLALFMMILGSLARGGGGVLPPPLVAAGGLRAVFFF